MFSGALKCSIGCREMLCLHMVLGYKTTLQIVGLPLFLLCRLHLPEPSVYMSLPYYCTRKRVCEGWGDGKGEINFLSFARWLLSEGIIRSPEHVTTPHLSVSLAHPQTVLTFVCCPRFRSPVLLLSSRRRAFPSFASHYPSVVPTSDQWKGRCRKKGFEKRQKRWVK